VGRVSGFDRALTRIENFLAAGSLGAAAGLAIVGVILRYAFGSVIFWAEEAIIYLVILSTFIGAAVTLRHNEHVNVDILPVLLGQRGKWIFALLGSTITLLYCAIIGGYAWLLVTEPAARNTTTPALDLPLWTVELALPIGLTLMFVRSLEIIYRTARGRTTFPEAESNELIGNMDELDEEETSRNEEGNR
jgi:C4-dicarboxylate transporter DctQ subunit